MPLRRLLNTFALPSPSRPSCEDVVMTDATTSDINTPLSSPSAPSDGSTLRRKRRHEGSSEHDSRPTASTSPKVTCRGPSSPLAARPSTPVTTPQRIRPNLALNTIDATSTTEPSSSHPPEPVSPVPTEIATDLPVVELTPEERRESLRAAGIKVRDFAYEPMPNACKAPEVFDPVPSLIAADWHMRNPHKNYGLLTPKGLFRLVKIGWLTLAEVAQHFSPVEFAMLKEYNDLPDERRYPFVVPARERMPTPSRRVRMRRKAGLTIHCDDYPDSKFFGYDPTGSSDDEDEDAPPPSPPRVPGSAATAEAEAPSRSGLRARAVTEPEPAEPKAKRRKVRGTTKTRSRGKPLRREFSRPEV